MLYFKPINDLLSKTSVGTHIKSKIKYREQSDFVKKFIT